MKILTTVSDFQDFDVPENWTTCLKKLDLFSDVMYVYINIAVTLHNITKLLEIPACRARHLQENCGFILTSTTFKPIDFRINPGIYVAYLMVEHILVLQYVCIPLWVCLQVFQLCEIIIFKLEHLENMLLECFKHKDSKKMRQCFNQCLKFHSTIIK